MGRGDLEVQGVNGTSGLWAKPVSPLIKEAKINCPKPTAPGAGGRRLVLPQAGLGQRVMAGLWGTAATRGRRRS